MSKYPLKVYKYRGWNSDNDKNVLLENQLFFTSPKDFNDPFDCRIPYDFSLLDDDTKINMYLAQKENDSKNTISQENLKKLIKDFELKLRNQAVKVQEEYNTLYFDGVDKHFGVLSLSERWDSILMWSHYADHHRGYCVGFWEEKLRKNFYVSGGQVIYPKDNSFPRLSPIGDDIENMIQQSHAKSSDWSYEKEYRLAKIFYPEIATTTDRIQLYPDHFISEIVIGLTASPQTKEELIQIGKIKNVEVYECIKKPFKFEIDRRQLL
jgi:hypothetical protein